MDQYIIDAVAAAGFDVWMRKPSDKWLLFTDGQSIGYLQADGCLSTVHIPNTLTGTGFQIERHADMRTLLTRDKLSEAFTHCPYWARSDAETVHKYRDIEDYRRANAWNGEYQLIRARDSSS